MCQSEIYKVQQKKTACNIGNFTQALNALHHLKNSSNLLLQQQQERVEEIRAMDDLYDTSDKLYKFLDSPRKVAMMRKETLQNTKEEGEEGLSHPLVNYLLKSSVSRFLSMLDKFTASSAAKDKDKDSLVSSSLAYQSEAKVLLKTLQLYIRLMRFDTTLSEEMAKSGSHLVLSKLIYLDSSSVIESIYGTKDNDRRQIIEQDEDLLTELQDNACEIVHDLRLPHLSFPVKVSPFTKEELMNRLPLEFHVQSPYYQNPENKNNEIEKKENRMQTSQFMSFIVQQVTDRQSAQEDVGFVMWPSAVVLSSWLIANPDILYNKEIIELGAGCGLTGLVASRIVAEYENQKRKNLNNNVALEKEEKKMDDSILYNQNCTKRKKVILTDFNSKVLTNLKRNIELNELSPVASSMQLDFYAQTGNSYQGGWSTDLQQQDKTDSNLSFRDKQPQVDMILAADVICKPSDSIAATKTMYDVLKPGGEAILVSADAKHRFGVDILEDECKKIGLEVKAVINVADLCGGKLLPQTEDSDDPCGIRQTSGFVEGMSLTMFRILKPCL